MLSIINVNYFKSVDASTIYHAIASNAIPLALTTIMAAGLAIGYQAYWRWDVKPLINVADIDMRKDYNRFGVDVLKVLDGSGSNLDEAVKTFKNFTGSIKRSKVKYDESLPIWGKLAEKYLEIAKEALDSSTQFEEVTYFINELKEREANKKTSYEWFFLFCDRLTILMTDPSLRGVVKNRPKLEIDEYRTALETHKENGKFSWLSADSFLRACPEVGLKHTAEHFSSAAHCKKYFPQIVMMPFPFGLDSSAIVDSLPDLHDEDENLWLFGFMQRAKIADSFLLTPSRYFTHDQLHLNGYLSLLLFQQIFFTENTKKLVEKLPEQWRGLVKQTLKKMKSIIREGKIEKEKVMNSFFSFMLFHESADALPIQLQTLIHTDQDHSRSLTSHLQRFEKIIIQRLDKLLPPELIKQPSCFSRAKPSIDWELISYYAKNFVSLFHREPEFITDLSNQFSRYNNIFSDLVVDCNLSEEFSFYTKSEGIKYTKFYDSLSPEKLAELRSTKEMTNGIITAPLKEGGFMFKF